MGNDRDSALGKAAMLVAVAVAHLGLARISSFGITLPFEVSLLWLPAGLGVAACMHLGWVAAIAVFAGALANNLVYDTGVGVAVAIALSSALQCVMVAWLLGRWCRVGAWAGAGAARQGQWSFCPQGFRLLLFYVLVALGATIAPSLGSLILVASGTIAWNSFWTYWAGWWGGDMLGIAVFAPPAFQLWSQWKRPREAGSWQIPIALSLMPFGVIVWAVESSLALSLPAGLGNEAFQLVVGLVAGAGLIAAGTLLIRADGLVRELLVAREGLDRSVARLVVAHQASQMATWEWDFAEEKMRFSSEFYAQLGYEPGEFSGDFVDWASRVHPEDLPGAVRVLNSHLGENQGFFHGVPLRMRTKSGGWIWLAASGRVVEWDAQGNPRRLIGATVDVTAQKSIEQELRDSEERFRQLTEHISKVFWLINADTSELIHVSGAYEKVWGRTLRALHDNPDTWMEAIHPEDRDRVRDAAMTKQVAGLYDETYRIRRPDGTVRWIRDRSFPVPDSSGKVYRVAGIAEDITESRRVEQELQDARAEVAAILHAAGEAIIAADFEGNICLANQVAQSTWGWRDYELLGQPLTVLMPESSWRGHLADMLRHGESGAPDNLGKRIEVIGMRKSGEEFPLEISFSATKVNSGTLFIAACRDVTESRRIEEQLRQSQKLEAIGQLTGGLAHDFNNLLGVVVGSLDLLGESLSEDETLRRRHRTALEAALRGAEVTRSLLAVARRQPLKVEVHDLNALLAEMLPLVRSSVGAAVTVRSQLWPGELAARVDAAGLSNALLNLVINARDSMKTQSEEQILVLRTRAERIADGGDSQLSAGHYAVVEVEDRGPGMSEEVRQRAFEPFFTTKEVGKGTGLGLSMVRGFAEQLGGTARIESEPGRGTTVRLHLPLDVARADAPAPAESERLQAGTIAQRARPEGQTPPLCPASEKIQARVLVVDDEPELCELASAWLQSLGYSVRCVHTGAQAIAALEQNDYDVLFSDVVMPGGMDGLALASEATRRWPAMKVLLASGYARGLAERADLPWQLLNKPYRKADLAREFPRVAMAQ